MITTVDNDKIRSEECTSVELTTLKYCYCVNIFILTLSIIRSIALSVCYFVVILSRERVHHNLFPFYSAASIRNVVD